MASGNDICGSCFRILFLSWDIWSVDVHKRMPLSRAVVTRLVTHLGLKSSVAQLGACGCTARQRHVK
jgi:hypothetical protein